MTQAFRGEISRSRRIQRGGGRGDRHSEDGLLVVEDGVVVACGPYADLAGRSPGWKPKLAA